MGDDERASEAALADHLERAKGFSEAHFGVPQKFFRLGALKNFDGGIDGGVLFGTEKNFFDVGGGETRQIFSAAFDGVDGGERGGEIDFKPFAALEMPSDAGVFEYAVHVAIGKSIMIVVDGDLDVTKVVVEGGGSSVLRDAIAGGGFHRRAIGSGVGFDGGLANFDQPAMFLIVDRHDVDDLVLERILKLKIHRARLPSNP